MDGQAQSFHHENKFPRHRLQIGHRLRLRWRKQCRGRHPSGERRFAVFSALLPVVPAMRVEQFVGQREYQIITQRPCFDREVGVPIRTSTVYRTPCQAYIVPVPDRFEPEIMAHPDIVVDDIAIAQRMDLPQQPLGRLVIAIVIARRHSERMLGHHDVAGIEHHPRPIAAYFRQLDPSLHGRGEITRHTGIFRRHKADKHSINVARKNRIGLARMQKPAGKIAELQHNSRIIRCAGGVIPKSHIPILGLPRRVPPADRQRRAVDCIERHDALRPPAKRYREPPVIAVRFVREQRMIPTIFAVPDQARQIVAFVKHRVGAQRFRTGCNHRRHHRTRKIDCPEPRIEPHDGNGFLRAPLVAQPIRHEGFLK